MTKRSLKERLSLRATCRVFGVSLSWLHSYAHYFWEQAPDNLGLSTKKIKQIKGCKCLVFGQMSYGLLFKKKPNKRWIWVVYGLVHRLVIAYHIGRRRKKAAKMFWDKIPPSLHACNFETDDWEVYQSIIPSQQHKVGKDLIFYTEGFNATIRARISRLVRKSLSFSKIDKWHNLAIGWFFWQFNLERQPYI